MKTTLALVFTLMIAGSGHFVLAQENEDVTKYEFDDDVVQGDLIRPDNTNITVLKADATKSLVKVRKHFVPEMFKTVENI
ncbi:MAG: hypothetical protein JXX29_08465 [Deltaproteobacteria bacterium]|nr:hypothetical protein [Deltaproteobacteria bacterium]MBN2671694.1 hypothetical protein [Deltaproteobacteria bacterium]